MCGLQLGCERGRAATPSSYKQRILSRSHTLCWPCQALWSGGESPALILLPSLLPSNAHIHTQIVTRLFNVATLSPARLSARPVARKAKARQRVEKKGRTKEVVRPGGFIVASRGAESMSLCAAVVAGPRESSSMYSLLCGVYSRAGASPQAQRNNLCAWVQMNSLMPQFDSRADQAAVHIQVSLVWFFTEVAVSTDTGCLSDRGQWVTRSRSVFFIEAWRQQMDISLGAREQRGFKSTVASISPPIWHGQSQVLSLRGAVMVWPDVCREWVGGFPIEIEQVEKMPCKYICFQHIVLFFFPSVFITVALIRQSSLVFPVDWLRKTDQTCNKLEKTLKPILLSDAKLFNLGKQN